VPKVMKPDPAKAGHFDAEIGLNITSHLLATVTTAFARRAEAPRRLRCEECGPYAMGGGECNNCGWVDEDYEPPLLRPRQTRSWRSASPSRACPAQTSRSISRQMTSAELSRTCPAVPDRPVKEGSTKAITGATSDTPRIRHAGKALATLPINPVPR
jgi:hypothetical protein